MLASSSSKPIVFHRNNNATQPKVKTETCSNICETIGQNPQPEANENKQNLETEPVDAETFTSETNKTPLLTDNTKEAIDDFRDIAIDVDCINLNNYPIIKKVVNGDIIIFKVRTYYYFLTSTFYYITRTLSIYILAYSCSLWIYVQKTG